MNEQKYISRLEELELNEEFQKLSEDKKIILIAGEKILEMNEYLKNFFQKLDLKNLNSENFNAQLFKQELENEILNKVQAQLDDSVNLTKQDVIDLIDKRYFEEVAALENKFQFTAQETINLATESFGEALQRVDSLSMFQIQAREEIRKNQDKIYVLEEELLRQKDQNDFLRNLIDEKIKDLEDLIKYQERDFSSYDFADAKFESFKDLENHISNKAKEIAEEKIEEYLLNQTALGLGLGESLSEQEIGKILDNAQNSQREILKVYEAQIKNGNKLEELEKLIDLQSQQIELLSEDRKDLIYTIANLIKNKKFNAEEFLKYLNFKSEKEFLEKLDKKDVNILIQKQAFELVKEKIYDSENLGFGNVKFICDENEMHQKPSLKNNLDSLKKLSKDNLKVASEISDVNSKISALQEQLRLQELENENLRNELFDEIAKNALYNSNNGSIKYESNFLENVNYLDEDDMKHNYYNGNVPIPGTKITRINNYRINNDMDNISYEETQEIIKSEPVNDFVSQKESNSNWEKENQKIIDLENTVQRQEEEINRLRSMEAAKLSKGDDNYKQKEFMNSLEQTLNQLRELSRVQAQTVADLERQSRKLEEVEQKVKNASFKNETNDNLDAIIEQKYRIKKDDEYVAGLKKIEEERRKIDETLELERLRLLTEINLGTKKLSDLQQKNQQVIVVPTPTPTPVVTVQPQPTPVEQPQPQVNTQPAVKKGFFGRPASSENQLVTVTGAPKRKRKQQIFYEVKVHTTPKLTRADIEK
ncbi:MAG: hypothetical protein K2O19_02520 [Malacoplasma sp.]|nr:hypothetical protein [Malacoplasma sp.]